MSEYQEKHTVSRLIGAPPGYVGFDEAGQLTELVRRRLYRVVLLDEVEKAHPDVFNLMFQILEDGQLTDVHGRTVDFRNTVVIMTSNLGTAEFAKEGIGFHLPDQKTTDQQRLRDSVEDALKSTFRPEFLNRIDEYIIFCQLTAGEITEIVDLMMSDIGERLAERSIKVELAPAAKAWLVVEGFDPIFGARPLRRAIQRYLENDLAKRVLGGEFEAGDTVVVDATAKGLVFSKKRAAASKKQETAATAS